MIENPKTMRVLHREETFTDNAVNEIGYSLAHCVCCLQFGRCRKSECASCDIYKRHAAMHAVLSDYDRERVRTRMTHYYAKLKTQPQAFMRANNIIPYYSKQVFIPIIIVALFILLICLPFVAYGESPSTDKRIRDVLGATRTAVCDVNGDGNIDCIDWAVTFKSVWDTKYDPYLCQIVRNNNFKDFHHLFVMVKGYDVNGDGMYYYVEPSAPASGSYLMEDFWGGKYNPYFNMYNETSHWMKRRRQQ